MILPSSRCYLLLAASLANACCSDGRVEWEGHSFGCHEVVDQLEDGVLDEEDCLVLCEHGGVEYPVVDTCELLRSCDSDTVEADTGGRNTAAVYVDRGHWEPVGCT